MSVGARSAPTWGWWDARALQERGTAYENAYLVHLEAQDVAIPRSREIDDAESAQAENARSDGGRREPHHRGLRCGLTAQGLWGTDWDEFIRLPSRLSAEPLVQAERDRLLARGRARGFIDDYQGVRIAKDGTRFRISGAVVWMVVVEGATHGQAALFREWGAHLAGTSVADGVEIILTHCRSFACDQSA